MNTILVVGCGNIGKKHINVLSQLFEVKIIACDKDEEKLNKVKEEFPNISTCNSYEEALLKEKPDYILICTLNNTHINLATKALPFTKHIFIEKPISNSLDGVDSFLKKAKEKGISITVGFNMRFNPVVQEIKNIIEKGSLGKILSIKINFSSYLPDRHPGKDYRNDYVTKKALGGGVIFDLTHELDYLMWIFEKPKEIFCFAEKRSDLEMETEDSADILLKINDNCVANVHLDMVRRPYTRTCEIIGEKGTIIADLEKNKLSKFNIASKEWETINYDFEHNETYSLQLKELFSDKEKKISATGESAKQTLFVALAAKKSAEENKVISL